MSTTQLREWALYAAALGWHLFPLRPQTKEPALHGESSCPGTGICRDGHQGWEQRATRDPDRIRAAWDRGGPFNIGIACGPSRLVVVDLDVAKDPGGGPDGTDAFAELATTRGVCLPDTYTVATPRGGRHLYFTAPPGVRLRNTRRLLCPNVDTRAEGGYVVAPGSLLPNGGYDLVDDTDPAELPGWIIQAQFEAVLARTWTGATAQPVAAGHTTAYVDAAVVGETERVRTAPRGQHNEALSGAGYRLGRLVGGRALDHNTARAELLAAARVLVDADCDCTAREVERVIDAALAAGIRRPRALSADPQGSAA